MPRQPSLPTLSNPTTGEPDANTRPAGTNSTKRIDATSRAHTTTIGVSDADHPNHILLDTSKTFRDAVRHCAASRGTLVAVRPAGRLVGPLG
jgi:hypothetical protein